MQRKSPSSRGHFFGPLLLAFLGLVLALVLVPGCGDTPTTPVTSAGAVAEGTVVKVACPGEPSASHLRRWGRAWAGRTGAKVEVLTYDRKTGPESAAGADLWVIEPAQLPRWAAAGRLRPVPNTYISGRGPYDWTGLLTVYTDRLLKWRDRVYALPLLGESPLCFYRSDWLADAAHKADFRSKHGRDLAPPATWDEFAELAEFFHQRRGKPSLPPLPEDDAGLDREFHTVAASAAVRGLGDADRKNYDDTEMFSFHYDLRDGKPRIASAGFVYALQVMQRLQPLRSAANGKPAPEAFAAGEAVLCVADASWIARFQKSPARPPFGVCRIPGSKKVNDLKSGGLETVRDVNYVPYLGAAGWLGVVPVESGQADAAFALLADLSGPETSRQAVIDLEGGGGPFRRSHLIDSKGWSAFNLDPSQTNALVQALQETLLHPAVRNPATCLRLPDEREHAEALVAEVRAALLQQKGAAAALQAVERRWLAIDGHKKEGQARTEYALSLGLLP